MYVDVVGVVNCDQPNAAAIMPLIKEAIASRRSKLVATSSEVLVFSSPLFRVYGPAYFLARDLPLGVSLGVIDLVVNNGRTSVRYQISMSSLRMCVAIIVSLLLPGIALRDLGENGYGLAVVVVALLFGMLVYSAACWEIRRFFEAMILKCILKSMDDASRELKS